MSLVGGRDVTLSLLYSSLSRRTPFFGPSLRPESPVVSSVLMQLRQRVSFAPAFRVSFACSTFHDLVSHLALEAS